MNRRFGSCGVSLRVIQSRYRSSLPPLTRQLSSVTPSLSKGEQAIYDKLFEHFLPSKLQVQDISGGCGTFYAIGINSASFKDIPVVKQHRMVTSVLKEEIRVIHGLQIKTQTD